METLKLCIPTLNRYDLCIKLIWTAEKGKIKPEEYLIVDNGGGFKNYFEKSGLNIKNIRIHTPKKNLGVAGSWNWFLIDSPGNLLIANDDILFSSNVVSTFLDYKNRETDPNVVMYSTGNGSFELFMMDKSILVKVGKFDENFHPSYFEDNDYMYRMNLCGYTNKEVFSAGHKYFFHEVSATLKCFNKEQQDIFHKLFEKNRNHYISKWGGLPHKEIFKTPFNIGEKIK